MNIHGFVCNALYENSWLVWDDQGKGVIFDPGFASTEELQEAYDYIAQNNIELQAVLLTHCHHDHVYGVKAFMEKYSIPSYLHPYEDIVKRGMDVQMKVMHGLFVPNIDWESIELKDNDLLRFGDLCFQVIFTPGHSPGSVSFYEDKGKAVFTGDTLFAGTIGITNHPWGDYDDEIRSIMDRLMALDGEVEVFPGHGSCSTIGYEFSHNPFLQPFNVKDPETGEVDGISYE